MPNIFVENTLPIFYIRKHLIYFHIRINIYYFSSLEMISTANKNEIQKGNAYFLTVVHGDQVEKYDIVITHINLNSKNGLKGITFKVSDIQLLKKSNGIIQGMSGSPIIQNGKLIGAVSHVQVNDPTKGYGIFIENMLDAAE